MSGSESSTACAKPRPHGTNGSAGCRQMRLGMAACGNAAASNMHFACSCNCHVTWGRVPPAPVLRRPNDPPLCRRAARVRARPSPSLMNLASHCARDATCVLLAFTTMRSGICLRCPQDVSTAIRVRVLLIMVRPQGLGARMPKPCRKPGRRLESLASCHPLNSGVSACLQCAPGTDHGLNHTVLPLSTASNASASPSQP